MSNEDRVIESLLDGLAGPVDPAKARPPEDTLGLEEMEELMAALRAKAGPEAVERPGA